LVDGEIKNLLLPNGSNEIEELMDNKLDVFVQNEGPHQIMIFFPQINLVFLSNVLWGIIC
jgi:hypothetical protein